MPFDWLFEVERLLIRLIPAYTLEVLDNCDIERILPYYFFDYRKCLKEAKKTNGEDNENGNIVIRNGKKYKKVNASEAEWSKNIF